ncbi:MAG: hypothetical protein PUP91_01570 [Rhizonema sp. PD37]|nr:hypothetical protein [Rhizonema sp. PD37]
MQCRAIFERIRPQLIENHYNWFIAIDAEARKPPFGLETGRFTTTSSRAIYQSSLFLSKVQK